MAIDSPIIFLASVAVISLSGVLMPGPVFAATIACGYKDRGAGWKIALGHALVEVPLIIGIFLGLDAFLKDEALIAGIGVFGGALLLYMGIDMVRSRKEIVASCDSKVRAPFIAGIWTTISNPGWILWWATIGAALITNAIEFGLIMLPFFVATHVTCDLIWEYFIARTVFDTKGRLDNKWHHYLIAFSGLLMAFFAVLFIVTSIPTFL